MPNRVLTVRSGLTVGSFDPTDRFTYWVARVAKGGEVLAPGNPHNSVQFIDARDLSEWIVKMIERQETGVYNATGKPGEITFVEMLEEIKTASGGNASFTFVSDDFLNRENVAAWSEMPLYMTESEPSLKGFLSVNVDQALQKGLAFRDLNDTTRDVWQWPN